MEANKDLIKELDVVIRAIPDFPKPGILFRDVAPLFLRPDLCTRTVDEMAKLLEGVEYDMIAGLEARGFLLGLALAMKVGKPFILIRKAGKLPGDKIQKEYALEYGTAKIEMHVGAVKQGTKVLIHDDLLATGGTAGACAELIKEAGGSVAGYMFIIELDDLKGKEKLEKDGVKCISLLHC